MTQQKANRIAAALTVNAIILIAILVAIVIYQMVLITVIAKTRSDLLDQIEYYEKAIEEKNDDLEYLKSDQYLRDLAFEYGFRYPD